MQLRESKSWGQEDLAHHAKVSVKTVSRIENGRHESRNNTIERIAKALGVDKDDLWPRPAPLGLGVEDPYAEKLEKIESSQRIILKLLIENLAIDLAPELDAEIQRLLQEAPQSSQAEAD